MFAFLRLRDVMGRCVFPLLCLCRQFRLLSSKPQYSHWKISGHCLVAALKFERTDRLLLEMEVLNQCYSLDLSMAVHWN